MYYNILEPNERHKIKKIKETIKETNEQAWSKRVASRTQTENLLSASFSMIFETTEEGFNFPCPPNCIDWFSRGTKTLMLVLGTQQASYPWQEVEEFMKAVECDFGIWWTSVGQLISISRAPPP